MNKIEIRESDDSNLIPMCEMEPLQVARIVDDKHEGFIVMRTASVNSIEVINLTKPSCGGIWGSGCDIKVELLPDAKIIVQL